MTEDEKHIFAEWYAKTVDDDIKLHVLVTLFRNTSATVLDIINAVNANFPDNTETLESIQARYVAALWATSVPLWFHEALRVWPGAIDPPSEGLLETLSGLASRFGPPVFTDRKRLMSSIAVWNYYCITPLKRGSPKQSCRPRPGPEGDRGSTWVTLSKHAMEALLWARIAATRARYQIPT
jgi:hypothetical protein